MSEHPYAIEPDEEPVDAVARRPVPGSLEERVANRRRMLESRTTDLFDVPGFEGIFQVELQVVGGKRQFAIAQRHERVHDEYQQGLRVAADMILAATVGFHSVDAEGNATPADDCSWKKLARAYDKTLDVDTVPGRVSLIRLLGEEGTIALAAEWKTWMRTRGVEVERDLGDFS